MRLLNTQPNEDWLTLLTSDGPRRVYLKQFLYGGNDYTMLQKIDDFLYLAHYDDIDYGAAFPYFFENFASDVTKAYVKKKLPGIFGCSCGCPADCSCKGGKPHVFGGKCSSMRQGDFFGRNYDWSYDDTASIVIRTPRQHGRFATVGVCAMSGLTAPIVDSRDYNPKFKYLPFYLLDGINEYGLTCSINIINTPQKRTTYTSTERIPEVALCQLMIPRYVVDHFKTADEAVEWLKKYAIIYAPMTDKLDTECHFLIADRTSSYVVEFIDRDVVIKKVTEDENPNCSMWMTNFLVNKTTFKDDGTVNPSCLAVEPDLKYAMGVERMNIIAQNIGNAGTQAGMRNLCKNLKYTRLYRSSEDHDTNEWYTELSGNYPDTFGDLPAYKAFEPDADSAFDDIMNASDIDFSTRVRGDGKTWQTVHSSVYDIRTGVLYIVSQEGHIEYEFQPCVGAEAYKANEID